VAVALRCETGRGRPYVARLRADARRLMALIGLAACELSIVIADDAFVHALNLEFRGKDRPTDVLSFSQLEEAHDVRADGARSGQRRAAKPRGTDPGPAAVRRRPGATLATSPHGRLPEPAPAYPLVPAPGTPLGDVVISVDTARRQARRLGLTPAARMRTLLVHGLLHLLGYDHERSPAEARRMFARERGLAAALRRAGRSRIGLAHIGPSRPRRALGAAGARRTKPEVPARSARRNVEPREHLER
jgi:ssRNA-specific RNase YbeY (16S rRNA maturation enzyme)